MNEGTKTGIFWAAAVAMLSVAAFVAWPKSTQQVSTSRAGEILFEKFTDPLAASSMKIVTFDEERGLPDTFEVRKDRESGLWTIPSRNGYPADALDQMKDAANALVGVKILDIQTSNAEDHDDLGVVEPKVEDLKAGDEGIGRLVTFKNESQEPLASLIIGDPLKDDPQKRHVRIPGQDPVYVVKLDESPLTTRFQDWIEADLLQLSSIDVAQMEIKDYSSAMNVVNQRRQVSLSRNYTARVEMDGTQWKLSKLVEYDPQNPMADPTPVQVGDNDKLDKTKLDDIKNALDDLKIADVVRKPAGMSANLRADQDLLSDKNTVDSLAQRGFFPAPIGPNGETEIVSANGELAVALSDGVKYILRFGNIAGVGDKQDADTGPESAEQVEAGVNRYLLVTTVVDESKFPVPELRPVPQTLEDLEAILNPEPIETADQETGDGKSADKEAEESKDDAAGDNGDEAEKETAVQQGDQAPDGESADEDALTEEEKLERLDAEQEKIMKENRRKLDERKDKLQQAGRRVRDLNDRFADWYYVIAEDTYSKLRIKRDELFETPAASVDRAVSPADAGPEVPTPATQEN